MPDGFYKEVTAELLRLGYARVKGGKGSHEKWAGAPDDPLLIVPRNLKSRHTANGILKDAGSAMKL
jgi:predicted RNA binding protein YcfA (HicA-like mRNA interferase family)